MSEAEAMVYGGVKDVLVTNEIVGRQKLRRLLSLAQTARVGVCGNHESQVSMRVDQQPHKPIRILLKLGWERPVEIISDVVDPEEVLPKASLLPGRLIRNELGLRFARFSDHDLFTGSSRSTSFDRFVLPP
jgi:D-serine deaminase-like pyridoxal phosphate-dependent protein